MKLLNHFFWQLVLISAFALGSLGAAQACTCIGFNHASALRSFPVAFQGLVESISPDATTTFRVLKRWKGRLSPTMEVKTPQGGLCDLCGCPHFEMGKTYRVYAIPDPQGKLMAGSCNPSRQIP